MSGNLAVEASTTRRIDRVRRFFDAPDRYLQPARYNIQIRADIVQEFLRGSRFQSILDIGCGDGSLSIPYLTSESRLTLLDMSKSMLTIAHSRISGELSKNVEIINEDFLTAKLQSQGYDLILCLGVLAHLEFPLEAIRKIALLLKPGGSAIIENADSRHFLTSLWRFRSRARGSTGPEKYDLNALPHSTVVQEFLRHGFTLAGVYRYAIGLPGMQKVLKQSQLYQLVRAIYGPPESNRNTCLGNECLYHFRYL
jgi:ubiquinone/menaquinone biosynthesis C-methylase UbiE